jgi:hypothetical protein
VEIETLGHAGLLLRDSGEPILFTDPWITGSCYWRSWWLQNYPDAALLEELKRVKYCFITHEHPDHFHTASIRLLGKRIHFLSPELPQEHIARYLSGLGYEASVVPAFRWKTIHPNVRILSIPLFNDDSALLIDTPDAVIINLNDSKPRPRQLRQLCRCLDEALPNKRRILLSSYSPASIVNSFIRDAERISLRQKADYVRYICQNCRLLKISCFMPFASQAIYKRTDSSWANEFKVTFEDLQQYWNGGATLVPPFTRLNLTDWSHSSLSPESYNHDEEPVREKVQAQQALDAVARFDDEDVERLRRKLNYCRWLLALLFPRGIGFELEHTRLHYNPWSGRLRRQAVAKGDFVLKVPAQAFKDAVEYGHFGDMGTTMFTMVVLNSAIHPRRVYLFFMVITLHDYGHTVSLRNWFKWLRNTVRIQEWRIPAPPRESAATG